METYWYYLKIQSRGFIKGGISCLRNKIYNRLALRLKIGTTKGGSKKFK